MLSEGLVIRTAGTRPRAPAIHYQSWNIQSSLELIICYLDIVGSWVDTLLLARWEH